MENLCKCTRPTDARFANRMQATEERIPEDGGREFWEREWNEGHLWEEQET